MRDMAWDFDKIMCRLGLEYFPAFGMLLVEICSAHRWGVFSRQCYESNTLYYMPSVCHKIKDEMRE